MNLDKLERQLDNDEDLTDKEKREIYYAAIADAEDAERYERGGHE